MKLYDVLAIISVLCLLSIAVSLSALSESREYFREYNFISSVASVGKSVGKGVEKTGKYVTDNLGITPKNTQAKPESHYAAASSKQPQYVTM